MASGERIACRNLVVVLGDQLNADPAAFDGFSADDAVWMAEVDQESTHVWSHKARIALFLSAMRHFRDALRHRGYRVEYRRLDDAENQQTLADELASAVRRLQPRCLIWVQPGAWRVARLLERVAEDQGVSFEVRRDRHFLCSPEEFAEHAKGRKQLRMEYFYRDMRRRHGVLMDDGKPMGGKWNYDVENREPLPKSGPDSLPAPCGFPPDGVTREVLNLIEERFGDHPGDLDAFEWPVTVEDARSALADFIEHRLPRFGDYQDAMWTDEPFLYHSLLSAALNLKLVDPREAIAAAVKAYEEGQAALNAVEGFVRQILGWREYVRGVYWLNMPGYLEMNELGAERALPDFFWTGDTEMNCLGSVIGQTLEFGYAHHIQRLMVTGLYCLLLGVDPKHVHEWYLAAYVDAVEWVELPNSLGMSQFADGGVMASKPYVASGNYVRRMSNYCEGCRFHPNKATGKDACPFTTLYWDFLDRHKERLASIPRMRLQLKNLERKSPDGLAAIRRQASRLKA